MHISLEQASWRPLNALQIRVARAPLLDRGFFAMSALGPVIGLRGYLCWTGADNCGVSSRMSQSMVARVPLLDRG